MPVGYIRISAIVIGQQSEFAGEGSKYFKKEKQSWTGLHLGQGD